jgi:hypothetical protein
MVMKSAEDWLSFDVPNPLNGARLGRVLVQGPMSLDFVVITRIRLQDPTQMRLAQDDDMVHALAAD